MTSVFAFSFIPLKMIKEWRNKNACCPENVVRTWIRHSTDSLFKCALIVTAGTESSLISYSGFYKSFIDNKRLEILFQTHITDNGFSVSYKFLQYTLDVVNILSKTARQTTRYILRCQICFCTVVEISSVVLYLTAI